jgi:hypothetical protein
MVRISHIQINRIRREEIILSAEDVVKKLNKPWVMAASARPFNEAIKTDLWLIRATPTVYPQMEEKMVWVKGEAMARPKSSNPSI